MSKDFIFKKSVQGRDQFCQYLAKNEDIYSIVPYQKFSCHACMLATLLLKRKLQHVGHKWIICGSHLDCSVDQWVKWVNRCDSLSTLIASYIASYICTIEMFISYSYMHARILHTKYIACSTQHNVAIVSYVAI